MLRRILLLALGAAAVALSLTFGAAGQEKPAAFARTPEAMALLEARCVRCHDRGKSRGGLDLTTRDRLLRGGENGPAVVPGEPDKSLLHKLVTHAAEPAMPQG